MKHGCVARKPVARYNCSSFHPASGYTCYSDRTIDSERSGSDLCEGTDGQYNGSSLLCQPLPCTNNYADCSVIAAARCDAHDQCRSFALNFRAWNTGQTPGTWRMTRGKFFAENSKFLDDSNWTTFVRSVHVNNRSHHRFSRNELANQPDRVHFNARVAAYNAKAALPDPKIVTNISRIPAVVASHPNGDRQTPSYG